MDYETPPRHNYICSLIMIYVGCQLSALKSNPEYPVDGLEMLFWHHICNLK